MKVNCSRAKLVGASVAFALMHYAAFSASYVRSEVIHSGADQGLWQTVSRVLRFPLGYLANAPLHVDIFPIAIAANSLLWGATAALVACLRVARPSP